MSSGAAHPPGAHIVLVGGGHAHVQVLLGSRHWTGAAAAAPKVLVSDTPSAVYSGMVPGAVAGLYPAAEAAVDLGALAAATGWAWRCGRVTAIDAAARTVTLVEGGGGPGEGPLPTRWP